MNQHIPKAALLYWIPKSTKIEMEYFAALLTENQRITATSHSMI